ncbi:hypothetical protein [Aliikangiella sp. IMCC44632]
MQESSQTKVRQRKLYRPVAQKFNFYWGNRISNRGNNIIKIISTALESFEFPGEAQLQQQLTEQTLPQSTPKKHKIEAIANALIIASVKHVKSELHRLEISDFIHDKTVQNLARTEQKLAQLILDLNSQWETITRVTYPLWRGADVEFTIGDYSYKENGSKTVVTLPQDLAHRVSHLYILIRDICSDSYNYMSKYQLFGVPAEAIGALLNSPQLPSDKTLLIQVATSAKDLVCEWQANALRRYQFEKNWIESFLNSPTEPIQSFD